MAMQEMFYGSHGKRVTINVRMTADEKKTVIEGAKALHFNGISPFIRQTVLSKAVEAINKQKEGGAN